MFDEKEENMSFDHIASLFNCLKFAFKGNLKKNGRRGLKRMKIIEKHNYF